MSAATFHTSRRHTRAISPTVTLTATSVGFASLFALGIAFGVRGWDVAVLGLAVLTGFVGMLPLLLDASRPPEKRQILITTMALAYVAFYAVPVFTQYLWVGQRPFGIFELGGHRPQDIAAAQVASLIGLICLMAGFHLPIGRSVSSALPTFKAEWSHGTAIFVALMMIAVGWSVFLVGQFGLIPKRAGSGFLGYLALLPYLVIALLALTFIRYRSGTALALGLLLTPATMFFGFFTGSKRAFLLPLMMVAIAYLVVERRIRMFFLLGGLALIIILYPLSEFYREVVMQGYTLSAVEVLSHPQRVFSQLSSFLRSRDASEYLEFGLQASGSRINALGVATVIFRDTPSRVPYQRGRTIALIFIAYIPRVLWPGKPMTTIGQWVTDTYGPGPEIRSSTAPTWVGELYFNFGYPAVFIGTLLLGVWFRLLQDHFLGANITIPALWAGCAIVDQTAQAPAGGLVNPINGAIFALIPIIGIHLVVQLLAPRSQRPRLARG